MPYLQHDKNHVIGNLRRLGLAIVDSNLAISGFAGLVGMLVYQLVLYGTTALLAISTGILYLISGNGFMQGLIELNEIAQKSIKVGTEWEHISWYGGFLIAVSMLANFVGARAAGRLAPGREYWAAVAMIVTVYLIAYAFDYAELNAPLWFNSLSIATSILAACLGANRARRANVMAP